MPEAMPPKISVKEVILRYKNLLILSLALSLFFIPITDFLVIQRDCNRNMLYGELFLTEGIEVYDFTDRYLNETYDIPSDHLLTDVHNVSYEYPIVTLLFYAGLAALEPGWFGPHYLANVVLVFIFTINIILLLYAGQEYWSRKWFWLFGGTYYFFGFFMSVVFGKADPLADLLWMISFLLYKEGKMFSAGATLGIAFQTKIYPAMILPVLIAASPLALVGFLISSGVLAAPLLLAQIQYNALFEHFFATSSYANIIPNPFYIGHVFANPLAIIAPAAFMISVIYGLFQTKRIRNVPVPTLSLRTRDWRTIYIFLLPLALIFIPWVLMWYYYWFIIPFLYLGREEDMRMYQSVAIGIFLAHALGLLVNFQYLLSGPIQDFISHFKWT
ncbi:MAG: glycosyltransferase family 87 protein [Candidatus Thorarchaeota archaeon]